MSEARTHKGTWSNKRPPRLYPDGKTKESTSYLTNLKKKEPTKKRPK